MSIQKKKPGKTRLHPRNKNRERYDLTALIKVVPNLKEYVKANKYGDDSVDFSNPKAVKLLNKALLFHYYKMSYWEFPDRNLCPPIPGRADYIHYMADLLAESNFGTIPGGNGVTCLDIGVGASCIYPLIGVAEYDWQFIGTDISEKSIESAQKIVAENKLLQNKVSFRLQKNKSTVFKGIITEQDKIDITICNPPFHSSAESAEKGTRRKVKNLIGKKTKNLELNFSGTHEELIYDGGERNFIHTMISESKQFDKNCLWFSTLVSKQSNLKGIYQALADINAYQVKTINLGTSNKSSRIVAWTFLNKEEQKSWRKKAINSK